MVAIQDDIAEGRAAGVPWDAINSQLQDKTPAELGYQSDQGLKDQLAVSAARNKALDQVPVPNELHPATRQAYADALITGETTGPDHFADLYHGTDHPPVKGMSGLLPSHADLTDHAIAITHDAELPLTADFISQTKANLADAWAATGIPPADLYQAATHNPAVSDALTRPPSLPPEPVEPPKETGTFDPLGTTYSHLTEKGLPASEEEGVAAASEMMAPAIKDFIKKGIAGELGVPSAMEALSNPDIKTSAKALDLALSFGPGAIGNGIAGFFRTTAQMAAGAEKTAVKEATKGIIREQAGLARQQVAQASAALEDFRGDINKELPAYQTWLQADPAVRQGMPRPLVQNLVDHIEGRSTGVKLDPKSPFAPVADQIRDIYQDLRHTIENDYPDILGSFHDDYYRHMWADPTKSDRLIGGGRMGSGASTQMRTIPTLSDGIDRGLMPRIPDPIDNTIHYVTGMRNFIAQQETLRLGREHGYVKYSPDGQPPTDGWVALNGRSSEKNFIYQDAAGEDKIGTQTAFAHPGYAGPYNNWVGKGFHEYPMVGAIYDKLQYGANMLTGLKLAMSGYHAFNIAQESAVAGLADGIGNLAHGELADAVKQIIPSATILPQPVKQFVKGKALQEQYLGIKDHGPEMEQLSDLYARAGGRAAPASQVGMIGQDNAMQRGFNVWNPSKWVENAQKEFADLKFAMRDNPDNTALTSGLLKGGRVAAEVGSWLGQTMSGVMKPLFENAIPKIKNAAFADEMSSWLKANPMASKDVQLGMARKLVDSMDDRFGELIQDNLFWPRWVKQSLNLATISVGWEFGTMRAFGGAVKDIASGDLLSPRARWLYSFPLTMGIMGSAYQYAKTGTLPTQSDTPIHDLIAPRTGGTVTYGKGTYPERAQMPGYQKDPEQWYFALRNAPDYTMIPPAAMGIAFNKLSPMWRLGYAGMTGKDPFTGDVIHSHPELPGWKDYANFVLKEAATPIGIGQLSERREGTNISSGERMAGLRATGQNLADPGGAQGFQQFLFQKAQKAAQQHED